MQTGKLHTMNDICVKRRQLVTPQNRFQASLQVRLSECIGILPQYCKPDHPGG